MQESSRFYFHQDLYLWEKYILLGLALLLAGLYFRIMTLQMSMKCTLLEWYKTACYIIRIRYIIFFSLLDTEDTTSYKKWRSSFLEINGKNLAWLSGGLRCCLFFENIPKERPVLDCLPLLILWSGIHVMEDQHATEPLVVSRSNASSFQQSSGLGLMSLWFLPNAMCQHTQQDRKPIL